MKKTNKIKTRIIASVLSAITVFSTASIMTTTAASAAEVSVTGIVKDVGKFALDTTIDKYISNSIAGSLLKMGTGYLLDWIFDGQTEKQPTIKDAIDKIEELNKKITSNHEEEMKSLKLINSNINTMEFRKEADSIKDDYTAVLKKVKEFSGNITTAGEGKINETTYKYYKVILSKPSCDLSNLEKNFDVMKGYVLGERHASNKQSGYRTTTDYLFKKITDGYKETAHSWKNSTDYSEVVKKINDEISSIHFNAEMDYITMLMLNNMAYKVREYEIEHNIYKVSEGEKPYDSYQSFETELSKTMAKFNEIYKKVISENKANGKMVQAIVTLAEPVDGKQTKGFSTFTEAWAQANSTNKNFRIELRDNIKSTKEKSFNYDGLDGNKYGFTPGGNFHVKDGRKITVELGGFTIDNTARPNLPTFGFESNTFLNVKNGTIKGGENALRTDGRTKVSMKLDKLTVDDTAWAGVYIGVHNIGKFDAKEMKLEMNDCTIKRAKIESGLRIMPYEAQVTLNNCTFENNNGLSGGAIYSESIKCVNLNNCTFKNNKATDGWGGALNGAFIVKGGLFENNFSHLYIKPWSKDPNPNKGAGGAIASRKLYVDGATFKNNSTDDQAGAIFSNGYANDIAQIKNCTFEGNNAPNVGGAIRLFHINDRNFIKDCTFKDNRSYRGCSVFVEYSHYNLNNLINKWGNQGFAGNNSANSARDYD